MRMMIPLFIYDTLRADSAPSIGLHAHGLTRPAELPRGDLGGAEPAHAFLGDADEYDAFRSPVPGEVAPGNGLLAGVLGKVHHRNVVPGGERLHSLHEAGGVP